MTLVNYHLALTRWIVIFASVACSLAYAPGDIVPMSRRGQYHNMRTEWHDTLGRHCPRFSIDREIVLPIPRPVGISAGESYKMALMLGRERYTTPWLLVFGLKSKTVPMIDITLTYFAGELRGVRAKVVPMPDEFLEKHANVSTNYHNMSHWPKHLLLRYTWKEHAEVDVAMGLYVLFGSAFLLTTIVAIYILQSSKEKLAKFVNEQVGESMVMGPGEVAKVD